MSSATSAPSVQSTTAISRPPSIRKPLLFTAALIVITLLVYYPVNHYPFGDYDDPQYVSNNPQVQQGLTWETMRWAFTTYDMGIWHPLTWLSHALDCQLFDGDAGDHHDVSLALHALNAVLLFWVLLRATGFAGRSFAVAALFAVHPINVQSVAWVAERKNVLSMFFFLLALGAYRWYASAADGQRSVPWHRLGRYSVVAGLYTLALLSKLQVVTFPCVLLLWDYWPLRRIVLGSRGQPSSDAPAPRSFLWLIGEKIPLFVLSLLAAVPNFKAHHTSIVFLYPWPMRIEYSILSYVQYLGKAFWPAHLAAFYPHPEFVSAWQVASAALFLTVITWFVLEARERRPYLLVGWLFFLGTLVPMLGLHGYERKQGIADRYAYLPLLGIFIMICWGLADWNQEKRRSAVWLQVAFGVVLLALGITAHRQVGYWRDGMSLWSHALAVTDNNWVAADKIGLLLSDEGKTDEALPYFQRAQALQPDDYYSNLHIGMYEQERGDLRAAIQHYTTVINSPWTPLDYKFKAFSSMCYAYRGLGDSVHEQKCFAMLDRFGHSK